MPKVIIPTTQNELREMLTDKRVMADIAEDPEVFGEFIEAYKTASMKNDPGILAQVKEQTEAFMVDWLKGQPKSDIDAVAKRLNLDNPLSTRAFRKNELYNKYAVGAPHDGAFDKFSDMLHGISSFAYKDANLSKRLGSLQNALDPVKPSDGGFLIPEMLRAEILRVALEKAVVRSRARIIPMDSLTVPFPTIDSTSNVSSVYGGVVGYWTEPGATLTESQPRFGRITLQAHKLTLYTECPNELLRDARPALDAFINGIFPEALAWFEDVAFTLGGGVGEPLGFMNAPCMVQESRAGAGLIAWDDIVNIYARMLPASLGNGVWIISPNAMPQLLTMTIAAGTSAVFLGGGGFPSGTVAPPMTLLGCPIIVSEKVSALGTAGDVNFVDFNYYLLGDRQAMSARQSEDFRFNEDVTAFRVIERVDGRPWLKSAITPMNSGATLSPMVQLAT